MFLSVTNYTHYCQHLGLLSYVLIILAIPVACSAQSPRFNPQTVIPRPFPAITDPKIMSADEAKNALRPDELVLGVEIEGHARAYPINMLTGPSREIINDTLGGHAIAATW